MTTATVSTYHIERHATATKKGARTKWHVVRVSPDGTHTLLRKYVRKYEAENALSRLNAAVNAALTY